MAPGMRLSPNTIWGTAVSYYFKEALVEVIAQGQIPALRRVGNRASDFFAFRVVVMRRDTC